MSLNGYDIGVIIPAYNEEVYIGHTIETLVSLPYIDRILVVDDGSEDNTAYVAASAGAYVLSLPQNRGKALAMKRGYEAMHTHVLVFLDADITEGACQIIKLIEPICERKAEAVIARFPMTTGQGGFGLVRALAAKGLYFLTGKTLTGVLSGQRAILRKAINDSFFEYKGFGIEFGMTADMLLQNIQIIEVDVNMKHRTTGRDYKGFLHRYRQFIDIFLVIIKKTREKNFSKRIATTQKEQD